MFCRQLKGSKTGRDKKERDLGEDDEEKGRETMQQTSRQIERETVMDEGTH